MSSQTSAIASLLSVIGVPVISGIYNDRSSKIKPASARLYELLTQHLNAEQVHPVTSHEQRSYPDCVYSLGSADAVVVNTVEVAHIVRFFVVLRDKNIDTLSAIADKITNAIEAEAGMNAIDISSGSYEPEEKLYHFAIELEISYPLGVTENQSSNAIAVLYPNATADESPYTGNCIRQRIRNLYTIVIMAASESALDHLIDQVQTLLIGKTIRDSVTALSFKDGKITDIGGGLFCRIERYVDTHRIPSIK